MKLELRPVSQQVRVIAAAAAHDVGSHRRPGQQSASQP